MSYVVQQKDLDILRQSNRNQFVKLELLNHNFKIVDSIEGTLIKDSYSIDSESDIRRTYNAELFVKDSSFFIGPDKKIWIDKYIRPYIGVMHQRSREISWYLMGTFIFNEANYNFNSQTKSLSLNCSDLMCTLNGDCGGYFESLNLSILAGSYIRNVIIGILDLSNITKYRVVDIGQYVPYDLKYNASSTYYEILKQLVTLYAGYEMFFDIDGVFVIQKIPTTKDETSVLNSDIFTPLVTNETINNNLKNVYNATVVWGMVLEADYYTTNVTSDGINYLATFEGVTTLENFASYSFRPPKTNTNNPYININGTGYKKIYNDNGQLVGTNYFKANTDYVLKYRAATDDFLLLGQYQAYGYYELTEGINGSPFSIPNLGYKITKTLQFDNLPSDSLCEQRAKYETWLSTRMKDTITLTLLTIPFLDVNWKITYTPFQTNQASDYIVKNISGSNSESTMNITMIKYSELYPDIIPD